ncbi:MAG: hypothetical protein OHK0022_05440 [Roseiflexaceae bacterium]
MQTPDSESVTVLCARIADLELALERLADLPAAQQPLAAELAEAQRMLALLQTGGVNLGVGTSIGAAGDIVGGDKVQIEQVSQTVYQIVLAQRDPAELKTLLNRALADLGPLPGRAFDLYQAVAAGLGRANVSITVDTRGLPQLISDPDPQQASLDPLFGPLLERLRGAILRPGELLPGELSAREARYRALIAGQFRHLRLDGLSSGTRPIVLPLAEVYVHLRAVAEVPEAADAFTPEERRLLKLLEERRDGGWINKTELREAELRLDALRRERWNGKQLQRFPIAQALHDPLKRGLVILGDPGSGKSTLLQFLALSFAEGPDVAAQRLGVQGADADRLPVFAPLAAYDDMLNTTPELTIQEFLARYYDRRHVQPGLGPVFDTAIAQGRALILLDGLDEVIEERRRLFVAEQASRFVQQVLATGNRVILTSRVYGYRAAPLAADLPHITVLDFRQEEIATFARQWFRAFKRWEGGGTLAAQAELDAQAEERQLLDEIGRNPGVERLAVNPLLLTMLVLLRQQIGTLPQRRITLYDEYVRALILRWEEHRSRGSRLHTAAARVDLHEAEGALIEVALWLQQHRPSGTATAADLLELLTIFYLWEDQGLRVNHDKILPPQRRQAEERGRQFLHDMRQYSGLLIERGQGVFGFRHLTFQEYFAGRALARMLADERWDRLHPNLHSGRWREPLLLCAARLGVTEQRTSEANALVMQVLEAGSDYEPHLHRDLFLAADCAADDIGLSLPLLQRIASGLADLLDARVPAVARGALERLHGLSLLRAGGRARLPEVQRRVIVALLHQNKHGWTDDQLTPLLRFPVQTDPEVRATLIEHLSDRFWGVRALAIQALATCLPNDQAVRAAVLACANDWSEGVRRSVVVVCAPLAGDDPAVRWCIQRALHDSSADMRTAAITALGPLLPEHSELAAAVRVCLDDDSSDVRSAALMALAPLVTPEGDLLDDLIRAVLSLSFDHHLGTLVRQLELPGGGAPLITPLLRFLEARDGEARHVAAELLAPLAADHPVVRQALLAHLHDSHWDVQMVVLGTLRPLQASDPDVAVALGHLVGDRATASPRGQHRLPPPAADRQNIIQAFIESLMVADLDVRRRVLADQVPRLAGDPAIVQVLHQIPPQRNVAHRIQIVNLLAPLAQTPGADVSWLASQLADQTCTQAGVAHAAVALALGLLADDPLVRDRLLALLNHEDALVCRACLWALGPQYKQHQTVRQAIQQRLAGNSPLVIAAAVAVVAQHPADHLGMQAALLWALHDAPPEPLRQPLLEVLQPLCTTVAAARTVVLAVLSQEKSRAHSWPVSLKILAPLTAIDAIVRTTVINCLAELDRIDVEVLALLAPQLPYDPELRAAVLQRLRQPLRYFMSLDPLLPLLAEDAEIRAAVVGWLGQADMSHSSRVLALLRRLLPACTDLREPIMALLENEELRAAAINALGPLIPDDAEVEQAVVAALDDPAVEVWLEACAALAPLMAMRPEVCTAILRRLGHALPLVRRAVVAALMPVSQQPTEAVAALIHLLVDPDARVRERVVHALEPLAGKLPAVRDALMPMLHDPDDEVQISAIWALAPLMQTHTVVRAALLQCLNNPNDRIREYAIKTLAPLDDQEVALREALLACYHDSRLSLRGWTVEHVARLYGEDGIALLLRSLNDPNPSVQLAVRAQLLRSGSRDPAFVAALLSALRSPEQFIKPYQRGLLSVKDLPEEVKYLARLTRDDEAVRASVIDLLGSPDWRQRGGAAHVLAAAGAEHVRAALPQLLAALDDWRGQEAWQPRLAAASALVNHDRFGDQAIALLQQVLAANTEGVLIPEGRVRAQAVQALGQLRALHRRRDVAEQIVGLLSSEQDGTVLDGLYHALSALASAPEPEDGLCV